MEGVRVGEGVWGLSVAQVVLRSILKTGHLEWGLVVLEIWGIGLGLEVIGFLWGQDYDFSFRKIGWREGFFFSPGIYGVGREDWVKESWEVDSLRRDVGFPLSFRRGSWVD